MPGNRQSHPGVQAPMDGGQVPDTAQTEDRRNSRAVKDVLGSEGLPRMRTQ